MKRIARRSVSIAATAMALAVAFALPAFADPVPNPGGGSAPPGSEGFITIMGWVKWVALGLCVIALIGAGAMMGFGRARGDGGEHLERVGRILGGVVLISAAFSLVGFLVS
jgi:type IV secretory pathway VirB2 component (pilin)